MPAPQSIKQLVERFLEHREKYRDPSYKEARLRLEFLDPFFEALGWDVANTQGYSEAYKDVVVEDSLIVEGGFKAPDYSFRIGGQPKFYVEAKRPSVNLKDNPEPALQLRRYAWTTGLSLSILTDFEEFAVYDTRIPPKASDKAHVARIIYFTSEEYLAKWDELAGMFSKQAILKGTFDKQAEKAKAKRGTSEVDARILIEISSWRESLAKDVAKENASLNTRELNYVVQQTIDRLLFLRICEDRGIEEYGRIREAAQGSDIYQRLIRLFRDADNKYNSGLFHFRNERDRAQAPDTLTLSVAVSDEPLADIISHLYWPESPYVFKALPADILGQVYEQFLGKTIVLDSKHRATIEEKPEVRKAGGVYYTPTFVVKHIVQEAIGPQLKGKKPTDLNSFRILDPACGSGSFLIQAYQYLLDWHLDWYHRNDPEKLNKKREAPIYRVRENEWRLTTRERKRILLNCIYGVDIDPQAVEVTKLSLLLRVLEGESAETLVPQLSFMAERALPDLADNIKSGNSLIEPDFLTPLQLDVLDEEARQKVNAFDWRSGFHQVFKDGGFNAVIGNPPYVLLQDEFRDDAQLEYFRATYSGASFKIDTYHLFIERGITLTRAGGRCSMITPVNLLTNNNLAPLRRVILERADVVELLVVDKGVFEGISVDNLIFVLRVGKPKAESFDIKHASPVKNDFVITSQRTISVADTLSNPHMLFTGVSDKATGAMWKKVLGQSFPLGEIADVNFGKQLRDRTKFTRDVIEVKSLKEVPKGYRPCYTGRDVERYLVTWGGLACLESTVAQSGGCWDPGKQDAVNKLLTRQIGVYPEFGIDTRGFQCLNTMFMVNIGAKEYSPLFVMGILNATLARAFWNDKYYDQRRTFPKIKGTYLKGMPVFGLTSMTNEVKTAVKAIESLVSKAMTLYDQLAKTKTEPEKEQLRRTVAATERGIDSTVYGMYGLTEKEIKVVESLLD